MSKTEQMRAGLEAAIEIIHGAALAGGFGYDLAGAVVEKLEFNAKRAARSSEVA